MSHTVHPYSHRLVTLRGWRSRWFAKGQKYRDYLKNDILIREFLEKKLRGKYVSSIEFERDQKSTKIIVKKTLIINRNVIIGISINELKPSIKLITMIGIKNINPIKNTTIIIIFDPLLFCFILPSPNKSIIPQNKTGTISTC